MGVLAVLIRPELVAEVKFLTWTEDNLLRQVVYEGLRENKPAAEVRRPCRIRSGNWHSDPHPPIIGRMNQPPAARV